MTGQKLNFDVLRERISVQVGHPTLTGGEKQKPELNQQFFAICSVSLNNLKTVRRQYNGHLSYPTSVRKESGVLRDVLPEMRLEGNA